ncbi:hypothetical protein [Dyadobacter sp. CY347]|uniref:hypothetical protein n=1 Tax=Dyadobacter sp. CY347 TaxID=2909336 RepID=UPI001F3F122A|nr:hypothetical protein [Dyadobacter sp. CY347]MCF2489924.1 hypothetical protein [Dyadobacter sp. CY347]
MLQTFSVSHIRFSSFINQGNIFISQVYDMKAHVIDIPKLWKEPVTPPEIAATHDRKEFLREALHKFKERTFEIYNSDLGKISFISCDFAAMELRFKASKIVEIFLAGTEMPKELIGDATSQQIGYGQLKKVYENRGDSVASQEYLRKELKSHYEALHKENLLRKRTLLQLGDFWTLRVSKYTNDFGTSWIVALLMLIIPMLILFTFHNRAIGYRMGSFWVQCEVNNFKELMSLFPEFVFPIHKADYIPDTVNLQVTNASRFLDALGKIWGSFMIYQFIQAFRKFGKK